MRGRPSLLVLSAILVGCAAETEPAPPSAPEPAAPAQDVDQAEATPPPAPAASKPADDPGPPPTGCAMSPDAEGFFVRSSGRSEYVGYVPKSYKGKPTRLLVGMHGCGDDAKNFAEWAVNPYATRDDQDHIGISIDGASGNGNCWNAAADAAKVLAAIEDVSKCVYVHQQKVVLAGFSSGGSIAYYLGLREAGRFAGILIENSAYPSSVSPSGAAWKINVAHRAATGDSVFPISKVRAQWQKLKAAGLAVQTGEVEGGHDGTTEDWAEWLIPKMADWKAPPK